ncbi:MAG: DUF916 domain-containing protein [Chloroflexi bacterium]|nr:DUF916 domain-containing protein [Chloroflexota bacterium]
MREREEERTTMNAARAVVIVLACLALLVACSLALFGWARVAQGDGDVSFGIRPSEANPDEPETFSFFSHKLTAGETLEDAAIVQNNGDVTATARVYLADGVTSINGGTAFTHEGFQTHGTANWLTLESEEITLAPGEEGIVSFTISVPAGTSPGEYVAGLVVQGEADAQAGNAGFTVNVVKRSAVAVLVDVPGARLAELEITGVGLDQQNENGSVFIVDVRNTGNILLKGTGLIVIEDGNGTELATVRFEMDTVLAHDSTSFYVSHPIHLEDGSYQLAATLDYKASRGDEVGDVPAVIGGVDLVVENGQPQNPTKVGDPNELPDVVSIGGSTEKSLNTVMIVGIIAATVLAVAVTGTFVSRRRRQSMAD